MLRWRGTQRLRKALLVAGLAGFAFLGGAGQRSGQRPVGSGSAGQSTANPHSPVLPDDDTPSLFPDTSGQKRNNERQRKIVSDTERLLYLTSQLKSEVAAAGSETLTPEMLRQMDEIEKLARSVKDKMRN